MPSLTHSVALILVLKMDQLLWSIVLAWVYSLPDSQALILMNRMNRQSGIVWDVLANRLVDNLSL